MKSKLTKGIATDDERKTFHRLLNEGRLEAVADWLDQGKPVRFYFPQWKCYQSALELSVQVGFYSIVKLLLDRKAWTDEERGRR